MDKTSYQKSVRKQKRDKKTVVSCANCGEDNPELIEMHHVLGRNNSDEVIPLCKNCHATITAEQNKLSPQARSSNALSEDKIRFALVSIGGILKVIADQLLIFGFEGDFNGQNRN